MHSRLVLALGAGILVSTFACVGTIIQPNPDLEDDPTAVCIAEGLPAQPMRRLSSSQFDRVISDLFGAGLGEELLAVSTFPQTTIGSGFTTFPTANPVNSAAATAIFDTAEAMADHLMADVGRSLPLISSCDPAASDLDAELGSCVDALISEFGSKAYRRPLLAEEASILKGVYDSIAAEQGAQEGIRVLLHAILQSPQFLYIIEIGEDPVDGTSLVQLSDYEMASRLSFLFLGSLPDDDLWAAAAAGELSTPEQITAQARRLVESPRAQEVLANFHNDWLQVYKLDNEPKDTSTFPEFTSETEAALRSEVLYFTEHVLSDYGDFEGLMTASSMVVSPALESIYGQSGPEVIDFGGERKGLLTLASVNAAHAHADSSSPILRGAYIRRQILCGRTGSFPADLDTVGPLEGTSELPTARERLAPLLENEQCRGCHQTMNPLGYAMENYDGIGRFRTEENNTLIDTSGTIELADDANGAFANTDEFIDLIAQSDVARECYSDKWFSYALARNPAEADRCDQDNLAQVFVDSGGDLRELMVAVASANAFRYLVKAE